MNILFRVDGGDLLGSGHVRRCLNLALELHKFGHCCVFLCRKHNGNLILEIKEYGFTVFEAECVRLGAITSDPQTWLGDSVHNDVNWTIEVAKICQTDIVIVDHYAIDANWESKVRSYIKNIIALDDLANRAHNVMAIIDSNFSACADTYKKLSLSDECKLLMGPSYCIMSAGFRSARKSLTDWSDRDNIATLSIGGGDVSVKTYQTMRQIEQSPVLHQLFYWHIYFPTISSIINDKVQNLQLIQNSAFIACQDLFRSLAVSKLAIGGCGTSTYERMCLGVPSFLCILAENQRKIASSAVAAGVGSLWYDYKADDVQNHALRESSLGFAMNVGKMKRASEACLKLVDGSGVTRICEYIGRLE